MKIALVYDRLNKIGGAEVVLQAFHDLFPSADWYTSTWNPKRATFSRDWQVHSSFLSKLPFLRNHHELFPYLMPSIFESFDFSSYDLVISIGSAEAKGILTKPGTIHLHYCLTPTRYLWSHQKEYLARPQFGSLQRLLTPAIKKIFSAMKKWDLVAASRPDIMISISNQVKNRVKKYYKRDSVVIYPPVNTSKFKKKSSFTPPFSDYYLTVARLVPYKRIDLLVKTFSRSPRQLVVVGTGSELNNLKKMATDNIHFVGQVSEHVLVGYYQHALAFVQANVEDFGLGMVEAQASGIPVIAYHQGGAGEIVKDGVTGILVNEQTPQAFLKALNQFENMQFSSQKCYSNAARFDMSHWRTKINKHISNL